jgi:hypothetical protein
MDINYSDNTLTIGDLKARLAYLEERHKYGQPEEDADQEIWDEWEELQELRDVESSLSYCWGEDNTTLINLNFWQEYCEETCYSLGDVQKDGIVAQYVDWEKVADTMVQDYRPVQLPEGNDFYVRA